MNFSETQTVPVPKEFLAIVFAGFGNELSPLTNNHGDNPCPKALLPVANRPMLSYILKWIEDSGLKDVLVVSPAFHRKAISDFLSSDEANVSLNVSLEVYDSEDPTTGTMKVISKIAPKCKTDFLLLPCDFFPPPSLQLSSVLRDYRISTDNLILHSLWYEWPVSESQDDLPGPSSPPDVVFDEKTRSLITVDYSEGSTDDIELRMSIAWKYPRTRLATRLIDSHIYICKRAILDLVVDRASKCESFKEDFLPWLCKLQYQPGRRERHSEVLANLTNLLPPGQILSHSTSQDSDMTDLTAATLAPSIKDADLRVGITVHRASQGQAIRANNLFNYMDINRKMMGQVSRSLPSEGIDPKATISPDSLVGESTRIGERTSIKKSIIGRHCVIGKMAKIAVSIIGDHCVIADGAKIEGCIISHHSRIGEKAELVKCQTQPGFEVEAEEKAKGEKLQMNDWTNAVDEDDDDDEEEEEDEEDDDE